MIKNINLIYIIFAVMVAVHTWHKERDKRK